VAHLFITNSPIFDLFTLSSMVQYKLRVLVGPEVDRQVPVNPNDEAHPTYIETEYFVGHVWVRIRDYNGLSATRDGRPAPKNTPYFKHAPSLTYSISMRGRFRRTFSADDLVFGNIFDAPLRLPPGASIAFRLLKSLIDPGLEADLYSDKPWAWSPVVCTMNAIAVWPAQKDENDDEDRQSDPSIPLKEHAERLYTDDVKRTNTERKTYFANQETRALVQFQPEFEYAMDFCNGLADFNNFGVYLPGWGSVSLMSYWDGQVSSQVSNDEFGCV
jgi:hypothetical protein